MTQLQLEKMTKRDFTELHKGGKIGLLTALPGELQDVRQRIADKMASDGRAMTSYLMPVSTADIDGSDTAIYEDYAQSIIYVYTSYKRQGDGTRINHVTAYGRYL